jgi:hypothetical protein
VCALDSAGLGSGRQGVFGPPCSPLPAKSTFSLSEAPASISAGSMGPKNVCWVLKGGKGALVAGASPRDAAGRGQTSSAKAHSPNINSEFNLLTPNQRRLCAIILTIRKPTGRQQMRQSMMTVMALAVFGATVVTAQAENQTARPSQAVSGAPVYCRVVFASPPRSTFSLIYASVWRRSQHLLGTSMVRAPLLGPAGPHAERGRRAIWRFTINVCGKRHHDASDAEPSHLTIRKPTGRQRCVNL